MDENFLKIEKIPITRTEVFDKLYNAIISGYLKPGDRLIERDLSKSMGVSRTPIREVLRELERINLVRSEPYKGVFVNEVTLKEANEIFIVRKCIEGLAARLSIEKLSRQHITSMEKNLSAYEEALNTHDFRTMMKLDDEFHNIIYDSTGNKTLINIINNLRTMINYFRSRTLPNRQDETLKEHQRVFTAIKSKNADQAEKAIQDHIDAFWIQIQIQLEKTEDKERPRL